MKGKQWENPDDRRRHLFREAHSAFRKLESCRSQVFIFAEEPLALKNGKTTRLLALAAGAIWTAHLEFDIFWAWVDVAAWKRHVVGKGNATKEDIQEHVQANEDAVYDEEDQYDAHCLMRYGMDALMKQSLGL